MDLAGVPVLACAGEQAAARVVLFFHGLHSSNETHREDLRRLAAAGYLALGVDGMGHGRRGFDTREYLRVGPQCRQIRKLLQATMWDIPVLLDQLQLQGYQEFACCGISWGAYMAFGAVAIEPRLQCGISILGCPDWHQGLEDPAPDESDPVNWSPHMVPERFLQRPWLLWNGELDPHVPTQRVRQLLHQWNRQNVEYHELAGIGHFPPSSHWERVWASVTRFLTEHFPARG